MSTVLPAVAGPHSNTMQSVLLLFHEQVAEWKEAQEG